MPDHGRTWAPGEILARIEQIIGAPERELASAAPAFGAELLQLGEAILERWLLAHGMTPTDGESEGFRLLALQRQGARADPSFNACRETCREIVYRSNLMRLQPEAADATRQIRLGAMVARHLAFFVSGKIEVAGLGEFCCSSRSLREREAGAPSAAIAASEI